MSVARPRAAIVGAGLMGRWHARYAARAGAVVAAIVDPQTAAAVALHKRIAGTRVFATLEDCLAARAADVVHVCTGSDSHVRLAETAWPAVAGSLPVLALLLWLSAAYGHAFPADDTDIAISTVPRTLQAWLEPADDPASGNPDRRIPRCLNFR